MNDGRVWSSGSTTGTVYASDNNWNNVFNGEAGNDKAIAANDATYEITLPGGGISGVTKVEIYGQQQSGAANATITLSSAGEQSVAQGTSLGYTTFYTGSSDTLTKDIEAMQGLVNTARVQAGSQYAAIESAVNYTTDLTAQYELGYNTVNDVNFSMETAHLAKNQILQQAATAMLAQANQGQQGLLQLIQG